jgi:hypothetical protein
LDQATRSSSFLRPAGDRLMSIGTYPGESTAASGRRRVVLAGAGIATLLTLPTIASDVAAGYAWSAAANGLIVFVTVIVAIALDLRPRWFAALVSVLFATVSVVQLFQTVLFGGLFQSSLDVLFGLIAALGALVALGTRAALFWFGVFVASVVFALLVPSLTRGIYVVPDPSGRAGVAIIATGLVTFAITM